MCRDARGAPTIARSGYATSFRGGSPPIFATGRTITKSPTQAIGADVLCLAQQARLSAASDGISSTKVFELGAQHDMYELFTRGEGMSRRLDAMRSREDQFVRALYSVTSGDTRVCGDVRTIARKLGYDRETCTSIITQMRKKGVIEQHHTLNHLVRLTTSGVDFVEITFADIARFLDEARTDCAEGAACLRDEFVIRVSKVRKKLPRKEVLH